MMNYNVVTEIKLNNLWLLGAIEAIFAWKKRYGAASVLKNNFEISYKIELANTVF